MPYTIVRLPLYMENLLTDLKPQKKFGRKNDFVLSKSLSVALLLDINRNLLSKVSTLQKRKIKLAYFMAEKIL